MPARHLAARAQRWRGGRASRLTNGVGLAWVFRALQQGPLASARIGGAIARVSTPRRWTALDYAAPLFRTHLMPLPAQLHPLLRRHTAKALKVFTDALLLFWR
jgi:hypothetical protein